MDITVAEIKSLFNINLTKGRVLCLLSKVSVYADSGNSVSYCLFTIMYNKTNNKEKE